MRRFTPRKSNSGEKAKGVAMQPFANVSKGITEQSIYSERSSKRLIIYMIHGPPSAISAEPKRNMRLSRKDLWKDPLSNGVNAFDIYGRLICKCYIRRNAAICTERDRGKMK